MEPIVEDSEFDKALGQFRLALGVVMNPLRMYGQGHYVDSASLEIEALAITLYERLNGIDRPFEVNHNNLHY